MYMPASKLICNQFYIQRIDYLKIKIKYFDPELEEISKIPQGDWIDLRAAETVNMKQGEFKLIRLGVGMILPEGYEAHIVPRSSTFKNYHMIQSNHMGMCA